jgi:hypothetical protein
VKAEDVIVACVGTVGLAAAILGAFGKPWAWVVVVAAGLMAFYLGSLVFVSIKYRRRRG